MHRRVRLRARPSGLFCTRCLWSYRSRPLPCSQRKRVCAAARPEREAGGGGHTTVVSAEHGGKSSPTRLARDMGGENGGGSAPEWGAPGLRDTYSSVLYPEPIKLADPAVTALARMAAVIFIGTAVSGCATHIGRRACGGRHECALRARRRAREGSGTKQFGARGEVGGAASARGRRSESSCALLAHEEEWKTHEESIVRPVGISRAALLDF